MGKAYGLFYAWEILPSMAVMGLFLFTVPMGTYAAWKAIMGEPKKMFAQPLDYEMELRDHNHHIKKRYYGYPKSAADTRSS